MKNISPDWNHIIDKYLRGEATEEEVIAVDAWYDEFDNEPGFIGNMHKKELEKAIKSGLQKLQNQLD